MSYTTDMDKLDRAFDSVTEHLDKDQALALLDEQEVGPTAKRVATKGLDDLFSVDNVRNGYRRSSLARIVALCRVESRYGGPAPFVGGGALSDICLNTRFLYRIGVDPDSKDDTQFPGDKVYCSAHVREHSAGWCTVGNALKLPVDAMPED